ncbi:histidine kinase [Domibacillus sp. DTU_2020_1001157_1_SI_ALB_TIR_016]|uniref:sensor histidine kinase n=1 Tax=Domibacillus sp. DTU_2020_1001157_1_SI_ALB_TIR_016 TaxID=3077789 RepID=UPI0028ED57AE|nr:histidine kinase [Domibacillus sp. DTU_2020_1001157_1_SI_ALB_TIR_016]WNS78415.1 histidine kinase [Domibacillus sp. DTU_2020_1001157_1_SI_ALB_TIR_016]
MSIQPMDHQISSYIIMSQEEELKRIALDLHEGVGQTLYSVYTGLNVVESAADGPEVKHYLQDMVQLLEKTIKEVRMLAVELHPPTLHTVGLLSAINSYTKLYTDTYGIMVEIETIGEPGKIEEKGTVALFRVFQESLANIAKYADTSKAKVTIIWGEGTVTMGISDRGRGFEAEQGMEKASGLAAMKGRMALVGGTFHLESIKGEGTIIEVSLPSL